MNHSPERKRIIDILCICSEVYHNGAENKEIEARIMKGDKSAGALKNVLQSKSLSYNSKLRVYRRIFSPTVIYGSKTYGQWTYKKGTSWKYGKGKYWEGSIVEEKWKAHGKDVGMYEWRAKTIFLIEHKTQILLWFGHSKHKNAKSSIGCSNGR